MASDEARDRFCADLTRRLEAVQLQREAVGMDVERISEAQTRSEHWWPYPDSSHGSQLQRHSRRPSFTHSIGDASVSSTHGPYALSRTVSASSLSGRRLSVQDVWHDANREMMETLKGSPESASSMPAPVGEDNGFPKQFEQALQDAARLQKLKRPLPPSRLNKSRSNLRMTKLLKAARRSSTPYEAFNDETFGTRLAVPRPDYRRRSSLLSLEMQPEETLIEEEEGVDDEKVVQRIEELARMSEQATAAASKIQSPTDDGQRRDSGYDDHMDCDGMPTITPIGHGSSVPILHPSINHYFDGQEACVW